MTTPVVPTALPLSHLPNVELMHAGTWSASTGVHTFTSDDFSYAVAALDCPAVRRPVLKLGHTDPRFDGQPAVGYIDNLTTASEGRALNGDYVGMPGWMTAEVLASAYPDRSIEGQWDYRCALGHVHPFVLTGVALLGTAEPAIGTLASLQDIATLYGVAASAPDSGSPVTVLMKGNTMPNPRPATVAAGVTTEDVRRAYYDTSISWSVWIEEMHLDPLQLIVLDDDTGQRLRVPVTVSGDGPDGVTFGEAVPVVVRYEDASSAADPTTDGAPPAVAASAALLRFANRAESRPGAAPRASATPVVAPSPAGSTHEGGSTVALTLTDEQETSLREALGLAEDADVDALITAVEELATNPDPEAQASQVAATRLPDGVVTVEASVLAELRSNAERGAQARAQQEADAREAVVSDAVRAGKIPTSKKAAWLKSIEADPSMAEVLNGLEPGLIPVAEIGHGVEASAATGGADLGWFDTATTPKGA
ncbi:phage protease [Rhodococcoides corynebacterioides]|uniref:phage protease n=1 Tax=Rhodococcoides corynebacterioides TaxID=53972 RepID=UPI003F80A3B6